MSQNIRRSQFILSSGPGAILECKNGPRIIPRPDIGVFHRADRSPAEFVIDEPRLSQSFLGHKKIFRLPSNAELGLSERDIVYKTKAFPEWRLCTAHWILHKKRCTQCSTQSRASDAIRFIQACAKGHMDDIDWNFLVHRNSESCQREGATYAWRGGGGSIRSIEIECMQCHVRQNLGDVYNFDQRCSGRYPEREPTTSGPDRQGCQTPAKIIQRQAANLRTPDTLSLFSIRPHTTYLHRILCVPEIRSLLLPGIRPQNKVSFAQTLQLGVQHRIVREAQRDEILRSEWPEIDRAITDVMDSAAQRQKTRRELLQDEFKALMHASEHGAPPLTSPPPRSTTLFEVNKNTIQTHKINQLKFRVTPVSRLHTVIVQQGYRRQNPESSDLVDISFRDAGGVEWLPGMELLGEGVFISLDNPDDLVIPPAMPWGRFTQKQKEEYSAQLFRDINLRDELQPVFVWWHTLAHILLRHLSTDSGYSLSSIRERVYFDDVDGHLRGGIILYTVQPGSDGSLGGLTALAPFIGAILGSAFEESSFCSNDPLCDDQSGSFVHGKSHNGAACYGCLLVSETSCEHRNMWLDRCVLR